MLLRRQLSYTACAAALLLSTSYASAQPVTAQPAAPPASAQPAAAQPVAAPPVAAPPVAAPPAQVPLALPPPPPPAPPVYYGPQTAYRDPLTVTVTLESTEPGVTIGLFPRGADVARSKPIMRCVDRCTAQVRPGRYTFAVAGNDDVVGGSRNVEIDADVHLLIDPDMVEHRSVGLALGVGGIALFFYGIYSVLNSVETRQYDSQGRSSLDESEARRGLLSIVGGLVFIPVGWVMYGTSMKPEWEAIYGDEAKTQPRFNLGFVPKKDGGLLGATLSF